MLILAGRKADPAKSACFGGLFKRLLTQIKPLMRCRELGRESMKVTGSNGVSGPNRARKSGAASGEGFAPSSAPQSGGAAGSAAAAPLAGASAIGSVDALLALQGAGDSTEARKRATDRAFSLLDILDDLKIALLEGAIPRDTLMRLMDTLQSQRDMTHDPQLEAALDEVELRAAVELAKLGA